MKTTIPYGPRTLLMDFYAVAGLSCEFIDPEEASLVFAKDPIDLQSAVFDADIATDAKECRKTVIEIMREWLVRDVLFILAAEVRHIYDKAKLRPSRSAWFLKTFGPAGAKWYYIYDSIYSHGGDGLACEPVNPDPPFTIELQYPGYYMSYVAALTATRETGLPLADVSEKVFDESSGTRWLNEFGGRPWLLIARAYKDLLRSEEQDQIVAAVDALVSLEHNTSTLFSKCAHWAVGSDPERPYDWIGEILDIKFTASSPLAFLGLCSPEVQEVVLRSERARLPYAEPQEALREDFQPPRGSEDPEGLPRSLSAKQRGEIALCVGAGDGIVLLYEGVERNFRVDGVFDLEGGFRCVICRSVGWGDTKGIAADGTPVVVDTFAFTGEEIEERVTAHAQASVIEAARVVVEKFVQDLHELVKGIIGSSYPLLAVGTLQRQPDGWRFRIKRPNGSNFRVYVGGTQTAIFVYWGTSKDAAQDPAQETLFRIFPLEKAKDMDYLAPFGRELVTLGVRELGLKS